MHSWKKNHASRVSVKVNCAYRTYGAQLARHAFDSLDSCAAAEETHLPVSRGFRSNRCCGGSVHFHRCRNTRRPTVIVFDSSSLDLLRFFHYTFLVTIVNKTSAR